MTGELPSDKSRAGRIALVVVAGVLGTALIAGGLWLAFKPAPDAPKQTVIEPATSTVPATLPPVPGVTPTPSAPATGPAEPTSSALATETVPDGGGGGTVPPAPVRAKKVAFRLGASIYRANEDGTGARAIVRSNAGVYALSPDGATLALVTDAGLVLVDVATGGQTPVAPARQVAPVWMPDSSRVLWVRASAKPPGALGVWSVARDGKGAKLLAAESDRVAVSPDGTVVLVRPWLGGAEVPDRYHILVSLGGSAFRPLNVSGMPTALAASNTRAFVGISNPETFTADTWLLSMDFTGNRRERLLGKPPGDVMAAWGDLSVSPNGGFLAVGALGDDEYSRVWSLPLKGGQAASLTPRRDGYIHGWNASGATVFLIDGNAYQGERTALLSVDANGGSRRLLVTGAQ